MAKLIQAFNARNFDPSQSIGGFPIGNHLVKAIGSEVKATKAGDGGYVVYDAVILEGPNAGAHGAIRFNLYSASPDAARIAHGQYSAMAHCCGVLDLQVTEQLHEIPFRVEVGLQKEPNPNKYTEVKRFFDQNGDEPLQAGQGAQQGQQGGQSSQGGQQQGNGGGWGNNGGQQQGNQGTQQHDQGQQNGGGNGQQQGGGNGGSWGNNGGGNQGGQGQQYQGGQQNGNQGGNGGGASWGNGNQGGNQGGNGGGQWGNNGGNGGGNGGQWGTK